MTKTSANLQDKFESLIICIEQAIIDTESGKAVNLGKFEEEVAYICKTVERSSTKTAQDLKPQMAKMISKLDELEVSLQHFKTNLQGKS
jgi:hypothetical protein